jgi:eukaryotic-like serine/threonine-protein kinase
MMTEERWQRIKEIFNSALERAPRERDAFLEEACAGDDSLRREVQSLITAHEKEGSFIDDPAYEMAASWLASESANTLVGQQINHYKILAPLGAGGMGEVYLAQDAKLGRKIALKLLPDAFTNNEDRLRRFKQEARSASALNHPNILTIHEIGEANGRHYIATELIEGETLRERLKRAPVKLSEALDIVTQTASALAAAHEVGIIQRDIKPENIMLRKDGYVKVLDFGLAKLTEGKWTESEPEASTLMQVNTSTGLVMGTVNYMSPEQARGLETDERTDIWSLGVVLYECVAGRPPFEGATNADVTVSILEREPPPLTAFSQEIPAALNAIVKKALRKERAERYQTATEMLGDLREVKQDLEFGERLERTASPDKHVSPQQTLLTTSAALSLDATTNRTEAIHTDEIKEAQTAVVRPATSRRKSTRTLFIVALAALVLLGGGFAVYKLFIQRKPVAPFQLGNITRLTNHGKATSAAISPDGKYFVYVLSDAGKQSIWLRQTSATNDTQIVAPAPVGVFGVTFSRDGTNLYYVIKQNDPGTLYRIPVLGGTPVKLLEKIDCPVSFSPDGKQMTFVRGDYPNRGESGLFIANSDGSNVRQIAARKSPEYFYPIFFTGPSWSPDGQLIACAVANTSSETRLIAVGVEDGKEQILTPQPWSAFGRVEWLPDMSGLLMPAREQGSPVAQIWHLSYPDGVARRVTSDLNSYRAISLTADASSLITIQLSGLINMWMVTEGKTESAVQIPSDSQKQSGEATTVVQLSIGNVGYLGGNESISWTPDDQIVFVSTSGVSKKGDIWIMNSDASNRRQLTSDAGSNYNPVVSPDGRYIVFTSDRAGARNVWRVNVDGSDPRRLTSGLVEFLPTVSADNQWVIYSSLNSGRTTLWKVPLGGGSATEIINREAVNPVVSPDGKQIAYLFTDAAAPDAPPNRIAIIPFEGGDAVKTFEIQAGLGGARTILHWSADGRSLLYTVINSNVSNIWKQPLDGGKPVQVTDFKEHIITAFDWSHDGHKLAVSRGILIRDAVLISNSK